MKETVMTAELHTHIQKHAQCHTTLFKASDHEYKCAIGKKLSVYWVLENEQTNDSHEPILFSESTTYCAKNSNELKILMDAYKKIIKVCWTKSEHLTH